MEKLSKNKEFFTPKNTKLLKYARLQDYRNSLSENSQENSRNSEPSNLQKSERWLLCNKQTTGRIDSKKSENYKLSDFFSAYP